ncbi:MAG: FAD-dependent monooxygenase [Myxococcales bacterium]|nr:FAD-dependent monooxygenase [Myxococcales bacterium]
MKPRVGIVGGGPVGMTLALELGRRGIPSVVFEQRKSTTHEPRCTLTNMRSMEHYRRLGVADAIRAAGVPRDYRQDVVFATRLCGREIHRFEYPSIGEAEKTGASVAFDHPAGAERPQRISQIFLEPVLKAAIEAEPNVEVCFGWRVDGIEPAEDHVVVQATGPGGAIREERVDYLAACDGGGSMVRKGLNIAMEGHPAVGNNLGVFFRSRDLRARTPLGDALFWWILNHEVRGVFIALDGRELYTYHQLVELDLDIRHVDPVALVRAAAGADIEVELEAINPWQAHQLVAHRYREGRIFLVGDAAHLNQPTGGFGMNTGVGDACDLGWKLAAVLDGWGGAKLLDTYEAERRPIAVRNVAAAGRNAADLKRHAVPPSIEADDAAGEMVRALAGAQIAHGNRKEFESAGVQLGYHYGDSSIVVPDGTPPPPDDETEYTPIARPGSRAPHLALGGGEILYDRFGSGFTLLQLAAADPAPIVAAAAKRGVPLTVVTLDRDDARALYAAPLVLIRPDQHVAWRGDAAPDDPVQLIDTVRGA